MVRRFLFGVVYSYRRLEGADTRLDRFEERATRFLHGCLERRHSAIAALTGCYHGLYSGGCGRQWYHCNRLRGESFKVNLSLRCF